MIPPWLFAEFSPPVGVDLSSREAVESYDRNLGADPAQPAHGPNQSVSPRGGSQLHGGELADQRTA
jgi:hypothetical protein